MLLMGLRRLVVTNGGNNSSDRLAVVGGTSGLSVKEAGNVSTRERFRILRPFGIYNKGFHSIVKSGSHESFFYVYSGKALSNYH